MSDSTTPAQSVQFQVLSLVVATLGGRDANVYRCRFTNFGIEELPADNVLPEQEDPEYIDTLDVEQHFKFVVRHIVAARDEADALADQRYVRAAQLLLADYTLGGVVRRVKLTGRKWEMEDAVKQIMACVATYDVEYSTTVTDPSLPGY